MTDALESKFRSPASRVSLGGAARIAASKLGRMYGSGYASSGPTSRTQRTKKERKVTAIFRAAVDGQVRKSALLPCTFGLLLTTAPTRAPHILQLQKIACFCTRSTLAALPLWRSQRLTVMCLHHPATSQSRGKCQVRSSGPVALHAMRYERQAVIWYLSWLLTSCILMTAQSPMCAGGRLAGRRRYRRRPPSRGTRTG